MTSVESTFRTQMKKWKKSWTLRKLAGKHGIEVKHKDSVCQAMPDEFGERLPMQSTVPSILKFSAKYILALILLRFINASDSLDLTNE